MAHGADSAGMSIGREAGIRCTSIKARLAIRKPHRAGGWHLSILRGICSALPDSSAVLGGGGENSGVRPWYVGPGNVVAGGFGNDGGRPGGFCSFQVGA